MNDFILYHKEYAPHGRVFNLEDGATEHELARHGWVDDCRKIGVNLWGPDAEETVQRVKAQYERGEIKALDDPSFQSQADVDEAKRRLEQEKERERMLRGGQDDFNVNHSIERRNDEIADAERIAQYRADAQEQVPQNAPVQESPSPEQRMQMVKEALARVDRSDPTKVNKDGRVKMAVLESMLDFDATTAERDAAQAELDAEAANAL